MSFTSAFCKTRTHFKANPLALERIDSARFKDDELELVIESIKISLRKLLLSRRFD